VLEIGTRRTKTVADRKVYNMSKKMLINASHPEENRVAIVVDGILSELDIEIAGQEQSKGNIYKAIVVRVETGLQAAFVDYGAEKPGFLQIGEINPQIYPPKEEVNGRPRIADLLQRGQELMVQIVKEERGNKGAALTTYLSIPGRYMVLMPDSTTKGVSRKISVDSERKNLKRTMAELELPERMGYIVRTAGIGKDKEELKRDFDYLVRLFEGIVGQQDKIQAPAQLYQESNLAIRSIRDYFSTDMDEVLIDDPKVFQDTRDFFSLVMPELKHLVKRHRERRPIFSRYQIEEQIEGLSKNQAPLPSGGSIVLDQTEALVAIDVNSGKMSGESGIEATAYKTNLEAAKEVGRQLRLRDLGGLIVIDFIDMRDRKNIREIEQELSKALKNDKAKVSIGRISKFGLMEMSRQRLKPVLSVGAYLQCPNCQGLGQIKSVEAQAVSFLRQAHTAAAKGQVGHIEASVPIEVANYLLNQKRSTITKLEQQLKLQISLIGRCDIRPGEAEIVLNKREKQADNSQQIVPVSHDNQIENALAAAKEDEQITQEQPQEQNETQTDENVATQANGQETTEKSKPRRRRRRKKPATETPDVANETQPVATTTVVEKQTEPTQTDTIKTTANVQLPNTVVAPQIAPEKEEEEKPKPRPRRRSRKKPVPKIDVVEDENAETQKQSLVESLPVKVKTTPNIVAKKVVGETSTTVSKSAPPETSTVDADKPKRRTRKTTQNTTTEANDTATTAPKTTTATGKNKELATEGTNTTEKPLKKPRRSTKKTPAKKTEDQTVKTEVAKTETKPKRQPKKTTKKIATTTTTETITNEKPQRKPRQTAKQKLDTEATSVATKEDEAEKPKRQPRKSTKTTTNTTASKDGVKAPDIHAEKVDKKPQRRTRKTPIKKNEVDNE